MTSIANFYATQAPAMSSMDPLPHQVAATIVFIVIAEGIVTIRSIKSEAKATAAKSSPAESTASMKSAASVKSPMAATPSRSPRWQSKACHHNGEQGDDHFMQHGSSSLSGTNHVPFEGDPSLMKINSEIDSR
jgi:hypothetical protein